MKISFRIVSPVLQSPGAGLPSYNDRDNNNNSQNSRVVSLSASAQPVLSSDFIESLDKVGLVEVAQDKLREGIGIKPYLAICPAREF